MASPQLAVAFRRRDAPANVSQGSALPPKPRTRTAVAWSSASQLGRQLIQFGTTVVLARLVLPADFGLMGIALVVVGFVTLFKDVGTSAAVIQKRDLTPGLLSTVFWSNVAIGSVAAAALAALAPAIAVVFNEPELVDVVRALSVSYAISSIAVVPQALMERELAFRLISRIEVVGALVGGILGISAALAGLGVWSLVVQAIATVVVTAGLYWTLGSFRPSRHWRRDELRSVAAFSAGIAGFNVFNFAARNADNLLIGRFLGAEALGYYALAYRVMLYPLQAVSSVVGRVMYPVYAGWQDDDRAIQDAYLRVVRTIAYITFPMVLGIGATADRLVVSLFGPIWATTAPVLTILVPVALVQTIATTVGPIYQAKGEAKALFLWGIGSGSITVAAFAIGLSGGIVGVAFAYLTVTLLLLVPTFAIPLGFIELPVSAVARAVVRPLVAAGIMFVVIATAARAISRPLGDIQAFVSLVVAGIAIYAGAVFIVDRKRIVGLIGELRSMAG